MPRTHKNHPPSLKAKVAVEAIKGHKTAAEIAQMYSVHPTQVGGWKKQALAGLVDVFGNGRDQVRQQAETENVYRMLRGRDGEPGENETAQSAPGYRTARDPTRCWDVG